MHSFSKSLLCASLAIALGSFLTAVPSRAENYTWKTVSIGGGGLVCGVVYHPTTPNLMYARTDVGGAYRWDEAGGFWVALNDDLGGLNNEFMTQGVLSVALDPVNDQRVYMATGQYTASFAPFASILWSTDRGSNWTKVTLPLRLAGNGDGRTTGERLQVDPNQPRILYLGSSIDGVWRSADNAKTWSKLASFPEAATTFVLFDKISSTYGRPSKTIYVGVKPAVVGNPSLYRSTDAGVTWQAVPGQPLGGLMALQGAIGYKAQNILYLSYSNNMGPTNVSAGAVWKLNTVTGVWTNITPTPSGQGGFSGLSVTAANPDVLAVSTMNRYFPGDEVYRSADGGATWKVALSTGLLDDTPAPWSIARTPHWVGDVEIDPNNPNRAIFVTGYGVWSTKDFTNATITKTVHWEFSNEELEETVPHALVSPKAGIFHLMSGLADIGGFRHRYLRSSPPLVDYFPDYRGTTRSLAIAEENSNKVVRTVNGGTFGQISNDNGSTWSFFGSAATGAVTDNPGYIDISSDGGRLVWMPNRAAASFSTNGGANWTPSVGGPPASANSYRPVADKVNPNKFYIIQYDAGKVWVSTNGGATFNTGATGLPASSDRLAAVPEFEGNLWLNAQSNGLYRSTDSGASFQQVAGVQETYRLGFGKAASGQTHSAIYIWGKIAGVVGFFRSDDIGVSWTRVNDDQHEFGYINQIIGDPRVYGRMFLATSGRGIIYGQPTGLITPEEITDPNDPVFTTVPNQHIYIDSTQTPWSTNGSFNAGQVLNNTTPVHGGTNSISLTYNQTYGIMTLTRSLFVIGNYQNLTLWVHGGTVGGQRIRIIPRAAGNVYLNAQTYNIPNASVLANTWTKITIPLSAMGLTSTSEIIGFAVGITGTLAQNPTFYLDDIVLE